MTIQASQSIADQLLVTLTRHQLVRSRRDPMVTVLVGSAAMTLGLWAEWARSQGRGLQLIASARVSVPGIRPSHNSAQWLYECLTLPGPDAWVRAWLALHAIVSDESLIELASMEAELKWDALERRCPEQEGLRLCRALCRLRVMDRLDRTASGWPNLSRLSDKLAMMPAEIIESLSRMVASTPEWSHSLPAVLVTDSKFLESSQACSHAIEQIETLSRQLESAAELVPVLPLALALSSELWREYLARTPETRAKAILREGVIDVGSTVARNNAPEPSLCEQSPFEADDNNEPEDLARSEAERLLFAALNADPATSGQFELNGRLGFDFGPREIEVDLVSRSSKVAIEVDGYYHFVDATAWRRDRRKDRVLQMRGYLVLRFLADDVLQEVPTVLAVVQEALRHRLVQTESSS